LLAVVSRSGIAGPHPVTVGVAGGGHQTIGQIYARLLPLVMSSVRYVSMASRSTSKLWRYWGYIVLVVLIVSLSTKGFGPQVGSDQRV
jgi:hypothetical protein